MSFPLPAILGGTPIRSTGPPSWPLDDPAVTENACRALADGGWGRYVGEYGETLRRRLAEMHAVKHVHCCASGTAAVELALRGLGVGEGDEVIMAAYDFAANFKNILAVGARPVLVDIRLGDAQIDVDLIKQAASPQVRAILVSHLHGGVVDMPRLRGLADDFGWSILEDACQMPGAVVSGRAAGLWGDVGVLSFGGSKLLTAGRGGCLLTNRDDIAQRVRLHVKRGNDLSPLSEIQAALLIPQLDRLDERRAFRAANAARLREHLRKIPELRPFSQPELIDNTATQPDYYKFAMWYDAARINNVSRGNFAAAIRAEGIAVWPGFQGLHRIHSMKRYRAGSDLAGATLAHEQLLVLHHPILLGSPKDIEQIAQAFQKIIQHAVDLCERSFGGIRANSH